MGKIPSISEAINKKKIEVAQGAVAELTVSKDDEFVKLNQEAQENSKDILAIMTALIMMAPVLSIALTLVNLSIDPAILKVMLTMLAGQMVTNIVVAWVMRKELHVALKRNTRAVYLHFSNKESVSKLKEMQKELSKFKPELEDKEPPKPVEKPNT